MQSKKDEKLTDYQKQRFLSRSLLALVRFQKCLLKKLPPTCSTHARPLLMSFEIHFRQLMAAAHRGGMRTAQ